MLYPESAYIVWPVIQADILLNRNVATSPTSSGITNASNYTIPDGARHFNIPEGNGERYTYMGWQAITSPSSNQYRLREAAGMNFDEEGFGRIDGRYVIACTTTFSVNNKKA